MISSPGSSIATKAYIFDDVSVAEDVEDNKDEPQKRQSLYVEIFDSMQLIVLQQEKFLFSQSELACLEKLKTLSYPARYLLIRLCLCKRGKWHTLTSLEGRYKPEIGGQDKISVAIDELCGIERAAPEFVKKEKHDVIDLTRDEDEEDAEPELPKASGSSLKQAAKDFAPINNENHNPMDQLSAFASDDASASVPDLLSCLSVDELKSIAKQMKVSRTAQNRSALIDAILATASSQSTLNFNVLAPRNNSTRASNSNARHMRQLTLDYGRDGRKDTQYTIVRRLAMKTMGRCVRVEPAIFALFDRLNLVFFRSTTHSSALLLPALLAAFRKRQYGSVGVNSYTRSSTIFPSREALLAYEEALMLEFRVDEVLARDDGNVLSKGKTQAKGKEKLEEPLLVDSSRVQSAKVVREIWEQVYDQWNGLVACKVEERARGLERFDCGHVLTRIVYKGAQALAILKEYELEMKVLRSLLSQTKWRRGRRGEWYDRLALVLMTHCERTPENLEAAMDVVISGLEDDHTHMTYRPRLERRLTRLENMLKIPKNSRHKCDGQLQKANEVYFEGVRIFRQHRSASVVLDKSGRLKRTTSPHLDRSKSQTPFTIAKASTQPPEREAEGQKGKTLWLGRHGDEVSVEQIALEYYEDMGFKGFHSEGSIVSTVFGLLFWDIIFASVPGAFETPFQSAPLDIHEDEFYSARMELIEERLKELEEGHSRELIRRIDERERPSKTWCIGVDWKFEREDLLEIVDCLGGHALGVICRMICEDYGQWRGGVPDLLVWNPEAGTCKFVEVKSPNDTLQENQKVWIDVLLGSETSVDLCHVKEKGTETKSKKSRARKRRQAAESSDLEFENEKELESEDEDLETFHSSQEEAKGCKRLRDSDEFIVSPKKRRVEATPRRRRKS